MTLVDLSHVIADGQRVYPHLPPACIADVISREASRGFYAEGTSFQIGRADLVGNLGTWVDAPYHRFADGVDLAELPLERLADLPGVVVRVEEGRAAIDAGAFASLDLKGRAVLFRTDWSRRWQTPRYAEHHPHLTAAAGRALVAAGAAFVGIDSLNVDDPDDGERPVHTALLGAGVPIAENLTRLADVPDGPFRLHAVPVKLRGMGSFPVRAYAVAP